MTEDIAKLRAENKRLLDVLWRIVASDPKHGRFAELAQAEAREAIEFCDGASFECSTSEVTSCRIS
jgi:hypothetical protein